mgnify:CR=1 FL=1
MKSIRLAGFLMTVIMTGLYLGALCVGTQHGIQLTHMMEVEDLPLASVYQWVYTVLLCGTVVLFLVARFFPRVLGVCLLVAASAGIALTALPLAYSFLYNFKPGFYENYVGEMLTILGLIALISGVSGHVKVTTISQQSNSGDSLKAAPDL